MSADHKEATALYSDSCSSAAEFPFMPSRHSGAPLGSAGSADHVVGFLLLVNRWSSGPTDEHRWMQVTKINADQTDERRSNKWMQIKPLNADQTNERRSNIWTQIKQMDADQKDERRWCRWTQIKQRRGRMKERTRCRVCLGGAGCRQCSTLCIMALSGQGCGTSCSGDNKQVLADVCYSGFSMRKHSIQHKHSTIKHALQQLAAWRQPCCWSGRCKSVSIEIFYLE